MLIRRISELNERELAEAFGLKLRQKRKKAGMTQKDLADKAGVTRVYVGLIERGETSITLEKVYKLASAINCSVEELLPIVGNNIELI